MKKLLIIGARGFGRCVFELAKSMPNYGRDFIIKGFLDDKSTALDDYKGYPPILSSVEDYVVETDDVFSCAVGDVYYKKKYAEIVLSKGGCFMNIIHPTVMIRHNATIGSGCIIGGNSVIDCDAVIGDFVTIQFNVVIGHDCRLGDWSMIDCFSFTGGFSRIGRNVTIHTGSIITPRLVIGDDATINAGSVVIRNVRNGGVVMGNPAKELLVPKV